jgi:hypothetical protein
MPVDATPALWEIVLSLVAVVLPLGVAWYLIARWLDPRHPRRKH